MKVAELTGVLALDGQGFDADLDRRLAEAQRKFGTEGDRAGQAFGDVAGEKAGSGLGSKMSGWVGQLGTMLAGGAVAAGAVIGASLASGISTAMEAQAGQGLAQAQLGLDDQQAAEVGRAAGAAFANNFGGSLGEVQTATAAVWSSLVDHLGEGDDALQRTTERALTFASVFSTDVETAVNLAGVTIQNGLARDAEHAFDLMTTASQRMPAAMRGELMPAMEEYGTFLSTLGLTGEEAFGLMATASQDGMYGIDKMGDALKELTIRSTDMSAASVDAYEAAGLNADEMAARFVAGGDSARSALDDLVDGLLGIEDPVARSNAAIGLFGTPLEDLNVTEIPDFLRSLDSMQSGLGDVSGATDRAAEDSAQGLSAWIEGMKRKGQMGIANFFSGVGAAFQAGGARGVVEHLRDMWDRAYPVMEQKARDLIQRAGDWITTEGPGFAQRFGDLIVDGAGWLIQKWPVFAGKMAELWGRLGTWLAEVGAPALGDWFKDMGPALWQWIQDAWPPFARRMAAFWAQFGRWLVGTAIPWLATKGAALWAAMFEWLWTDAVPALWRGLGSLISAIRDWLTGTAIPWLREKGGQWFGVLKDKAAEKGLEMVAWLRTLPGTIRSWIIGTALPALRSLAAQWFGQLLSAAQQKGAELMGWFTGLPGQIMSALAGMHGRLLQTGRDMVQGLLNGIRQKAGEIARAVVDPIIAAWEKARSFLGMNSPSRLYMGMGQNIVEGLVLGIEQKQKMAGASIGGLGADLARMGRSLDADLYAGMRGPGGLMGPGPRSLVEAGGSDRPIVLNLRADLSIGGERIDERIDTRLTADDAETARLVRVGEGRFG